MTSTSADRPTVAVLDRASFRARREDIIDVYAEAMGVDRAAALSRRSILAAHEDRAGLIAVAAVDSGQRLLGIAYGYLGEPGQWWHDQVELALSPSQCRDWLAGAFEVCELHVRPALQGTGLGRSLLSSLLDLTSAPVAVLTTPDGVPTRARRFYAAGGWTELMSKLQFPGDTRTFAVLGRRLDGQRAPVGSS